MKFYYPKGVAIDNDESIIVVDSWNNRIRKIDSNGEVTTIAGSTMGYADGTGTSAQFNSPDGLAIDNDGAIIVADSYNHRIRKIDSNGEVSTIAGSTEGYADGIGENAQFDTPMGVAIDNDGAVIVADSFNHRIRKIDSNREVSTIAGVGETERYVLFQMPVGVAIDKDGSIIVADAGKNRIRKIHSNRDVTTIAGSGYGNSDGTGKNALFYMPHGVAIDNDGVIIVTDGFNNRIRKIEIK